MFLLFKQTFAMSVCKHNQNQIKITALQFFFNLAMKLDQRFNF